MVKEKIYEKIVAEVNPNVEHPQLSERSIRELIDDLVPEDITDEGVDDFVKNKISIFKIMANNVRKDVSDFSKKLEDRNKQTQKTEPDKKDDKTPDKDPLNELMLKLQSIEDKLNVQESAKASERLKDSLLSNALKIYPENVVTASSMNFDFGGENAEREFPVKLSEMAKLFDVEPISGKPKDDEPDFEAFKARNKERFKYS